VRTVAEEYDRVVGVDTHAATHTMSLLIAATGAVVEHRNFPTSAAGLRRALTWIGNRTQDRTCLVVVEGTGSYGGAADRAFHPGRDRRRRGPDHPRRETPRQGRRHGLRPDRPRCAGVAARSAVLATCWRHPDRDPRAGLRARLDGH
jgi:hypothetical protein